MLGAGGAIIGRANLKDVDKQTGVAELGYRVGQDQVGTGVATAAVQQMKRIAQAQMGLQRLDAVVLKTNLASRRVLEKCGFVQIQDAQTSGHAGRAQKLVNYRCDLS